MVIRIFFIFVFSLQPQKKHLCEAIQKRKNEMKINHTHTQTQKTTQNETKRNEHDYID